MCGHILVSGDISYLKSNTDKGFEKIFSVKLNSENMDFRIQQMKITGSKKQTATQ
jgi:hypothetical protein